MAIRGRTLDQDFVGHERLFLRVMEVTEDGLHPLPAALDLIYPGSDGMSTNREKYSVPEDVIWPDWPDSGIASITVESVRKCLFEVAGQGQRIYALDIRHDPDTTRFENYAHTLIRTLLTPQTHHVKPPPSVRKKARQDLAGLMGILRQPRS